MALADFGQLSGSEAGARNGQERVECGPERAGGLTGAVRRLPQEPPTTRGNRRDRARKNPNRERLGFHYWWWDGTPHQTTIESTRYRRSGKLRSPAYQCEKRGLTGESADIQAGFLPRLVAGNGVQPRLFSRASSVPKRGIEPASVILSAGRTRRHGRCHAGSACHAPPAPGNAA